MDGGRGLHGGVVKPKGGLFPLFKHRPLGGEFKTEQDIVNWFKARGLDVIGRVEINPEPDHHLNYRVCETALNLYVKTIKECNSKGHNGSPLFHKIYRKIILEDCGFLIDPPNVSHGGVVKPKGGLFPLFKHRPLGGEFKTEQDIVNWFKARGLDVIGRVEINPEPDHHLNYRVCETTLNLYVKTIRECNSEGHNGSPLFHETYSKIIREDCGFLIAPPDGKDL